MGKNNSIRRVTPIEKCIFCGAEDPTSEEHILARWIYRSLDNHGLDYDKEKQYTTSNHEGTVTEFIKVQSEDTTIPALCDDCNNHWGSDLQDEVAGTLRPFIIGNWTALDERQRMRIVKWYTSYLMVRQFAADGHDVFTPFQRKAFRMNWTIPNNLNIWMAPISSVSLDAIHRAMTNLFTEKPSNKPDIFITVQGVGKVIFVGFGADPRGFHGVGSGQFHAIYKCFEHHNLIPLWLWDKEYLIKFPKRKPEFCLTDDTNYLCKIGCTALSNSLDWLPGGKYRTQGKVLFTI